MDSYDILVIVLSVMLAIFLLLSIIVAVLLLKLIKKVSVATDSATRAVENVEAMTGTLKNVANGSVIAGVVGSIFDKFKAKSTKNKGNK